MILRMKSIIGFPKFIFRKNLLLYIWVRTKEWTVSKWCFSRQLSTTFDVWRMRTRSEPLQRFIWIYSPEPLCFPISYQKSRSIPTAIKAFPTDWYCFEVEADYAIQSSECHRIPSMPSRPKNRNNSNEVAIANCVEAAHTSQWILSMKQKKLHLRIDVDTLQIYVARTASNSLAKHFFTHFCSFLQEPHIGSVMLG